MSLAFTPPRSPSGPAPVRPTLSGIVRGKVTGRAGRIKRLLLETSTGAVEVRLPKFLHPLAELEFEIGDPLRVWLQSGRKALRALALVPLRPQAILPSPCQAARTCIMVCTGKGCGRRGGRELHRQMLQAVKNHPGLEIKQCGCLKRCSRGPNVKIPGIGVASVKATDAPQLFHQLECAAQSVWN